MFVHPVHFLMVLLFPVPVDPTTRIALIGFSELASSIDLFEGMFVTTLGVCLKALKHMSAF